MAADYPDSGFSAHSTAEQVLSGIDLQGVRALITGATAGLGYETARALLKQGAQVVISGRDRSKLDRALAQLSEAHPQSLVRAALFDLGKPEQVRRFSADFVAAEAGGLDLLINNAGVMACPLERNEHGWEMQFATNHLGHFLLAAGLLPLLRKGRGARVVSVSSSAHFFSDVTFEDIHYERRKYDKWRAYGQSKTANILFAVGLSERYGQDGVFANALHPGVIQTDLLRHLSIDESEQMMTRVQQLKRHIKDVPSGAATTVWAATSPLLEGRGGLYLEDCNFSRLRGDDEKGADDGQPPGYMGYAVDSDHARQLWQISNQTLGVSV